MSTIATLTERPCALADGEQRQPSSHHLQPTRRLSRSQRACHAQGSHRPAPPGAHRARPRPPRSENNIACHHFGFAWSYPLGWPRSSRASSRPHHHGHGAARAGLASSRSSSPAPASTPIRSRDGVWSLMAKTHPDLEFANHCGPRAGRCARHRAGRQHPLRRLMTMICTVWAACRWCWPRRGAERASARLGLVGAWPGLGLHAVPHAVSPTALGASPPKSTAAAPRASLRRPPTSMSAPRFAKWFAQLVCPSGLPEWFDGARLIQ